MKTYLFTLSVFILAFFSHINIAHSQNWQYYNDIVLEYYLENNYDSALIYAYKAKDYAELEFGKNDWHYAFEILRILKLDSSIGKDYDKELIEALENCETDSVKGTISEQTDYFSYILEGYKLAKISKNLEKIKKKDEIIKSKFNELYSEFNNYYNKANEFFLNNNIEEAYKNLNKSAEICEKLFSENSDDYKIVFQNLGYLFIIHFANQNDNIKYDSPQLVKSLNILGAYYLMQNIIDTAYIALRNALNISRRLYKDDHPYLATSINNLGQFYDNINRNEEAEKLLKEALEMRRRLYKDDHPDLATSINNLGSFYNNINRNEEAEKLYKEALEMTRRLYKDDHPYLARSINNLGMFYANINRNEEAEKLLIEALEMNKNLLKKNISYLPEKEKYLYWQSTFHEFLRFHSYSKDRYSENPKITIPQYESLLLTKAMLLNSQQKLRQVISSISDEQIKQNFQRWLDLKSYIASLYSLPFDTLRQRGISIDSLNRVANDQEKYLIEQLPQYKELIAQKSFSIQDVKDKLKEGECAIEIVRFPYYKFKENQWTDTICYSALILTKDIESPRLVVIEEGAVIDTLLYSKYLEAIYRKTNMDPVLINMYLVMWQPIEKALPKNIKKIYIAPDGAYNLVNLETFLNPDNNKYLIELYEFCYLNSTRELVEESKNWKLANKTAVLYGDPAFDLDSVQYSNLIVKAESVKEKSIVETAYIPTKDLTNINCKALSSTKEEVEHISESLKNSGFITKEYLGEDALEETVKKLNNPRIIYFSTHGYFIKDSIIIQSNLKQERFLGMEAEKYVINPNLRSGILLAGACSYANNKRSIKNTEGKLQDDGFLTAEEASLLRLDSTQLVILSACETGQGVVMSGEGVSGLTRAFKSAGTESIIMSLWSVDLIGTKQLFEELFKQCYGSGNEKDISSTLYEIKKSMHRKELNYEYNGEQHDFSAPYYWGSFILLGK